MDQLNTSTIDTSAFIKTVSTSDIDDTLSYIMSSGINLLPLEYELHRHYGVRLIKLQTQYKLKFKLPLYIVAMTDTIKPPDDALCYVYCMNIIRTSLEEYPLYNEIIQKYYDQLNGLPENIICEIIYCISYFNCLMECTCKQNFSNYILNDYLIYDIGEIIDENRSAIRHNRVGVTLHIIKLLKDIDMSTLSPELSSLLFDIMFEFYSGCNLICFENNKKCLLENDQTEYPTILTHLETNRKSDTYSHKTPDIFKFGIHHQIPIVRQTESVNEEGKDIFEHIASLVENVDDIDELDKIVDDYGGNDFPLDIIYLFPKKPWSTEKLVKHNNFTFFFVRDYSNQSWNWKELSSHPKLTIDDIIYLRDKSWDWDIIMNRHDIITEFMNRRSQRFGEYPESDDIRELYKTDCQSRDIFKAFCLMKKNGL